MTDDPTVFTAPGEETGRARKQMRVSLDQSMHGLKELAFRFADLLGVEDMRTLLLIRIHEGALDVCDAVAELSDGRAAFGLALALIEHLDYVCDYVTNHSDWIPRNVHYGSTFARIRARIRVKKQAKEFRFRTRSFFRSVEPILEIVFPPVCPPPGDIPQKKREAIEDRIFCRGYQPFDESCRTMKMIRDHFAERNGETPPPEPKAPSLDVFDDVF